VATARLFASSVARQVGCSEDTVEDLKLAISESCGILVRGSGHRDALHLRLQPDREELLVEVVGGDPIPEGVLDGREDTPDSFARSTSVDVLRSLYPEAEIMPTSETTRVTFRIPVEDRPTA
jgi:hypothetical protein